MTKPLLIEEENLSRAWLRVIDYIDNNSGYEISPLVLSMTEFDECIEFKNTLNTYLNSSSLDSTDTVSETIFPVSLYEYCDYDRRQLYHQYQKILPRIKKIDNRNKEGTYFERLISFGDTRVNQLENIITSLEQPKVRRSKLQASIFNPYTDHKEGPYQKFPCLQHVTFYKTKSGLVINSFYAMQYLYQRGYGNWLGLINLGKFVAKELNIKLERFNCHVGIEKLEVSKGKVRKLLKTPSAQKLLKKV